jgi:hypothetical protein
LPHLYIAVFFSVYTLAICPLHLADLRLRRGASPKRHKARKRRIRRSTYGHQHDDGSSDGQVIGEDFSTFRPGETRRRLPL